MHWPILILSLLFVTSCGKSNSNAGMPRLKAPKAPVSSEVTPLKKFYLTNLSEINPALTGQLSGLFSVEQTGLSYVSKIGISTDGWHQDSIHEGSRCPTLSDDTNGDQVIDTAEAMAVVGREMVSLNDRSFTTSFSGNYDFNGKVILLNSATEAMACGVLRIVSNLPNDRDYYRRPTPRPRPTPNPETEPDPNETDSDDDNDDDDSWADRFNHWWRCRFGGCR